MKITSILAIAAGLLITSCYEDKGDYDYRDDVLEAQVLLKKTYGIKKEKQPFSYTITPEINVPDAYKKNLSYEWYVNTQNEQQKGELAGTEESLLIEIDPSQPIPPVYYIRLIATDNVTGAKNLQYAQFSVINPYTYAWAVLHETDGHAEVGAVEYVGGEMIVTPDAYTKDSGKSLTGKPISMYSGQYSVNWAGGLYKANSSCYLTTTNEEESGLINPGDDFKLFGKWSEMICPAQMEYFSPDDAYYSESGGGGYGSMLLSKGKVFRRRTGGAALYLMTPPSEVAASEIGDYYITHLASGPHVGVGYDKNSHRFLEFNLQKGDYWYDIFPPAGTIRRGGDVTLIPSNVDNEIDVNKPIAANQEVIAIFNGFHNYIWDFAYWQQYMIYAYAIAGSRSYVYPFHCYSLSHDTPAVPKYYEFTTPEGIDKNTRFTTGSKFNNILFYAVKNKVYRLDASSGKTTMIYQHEDPSAEISALKMACEGYSFNDQDDVIGTDEYGIPYSRCLGVAFNLSDGTGELVVLQLGTNGRILEDESKYPSVQVHKGFGPIKSIAFI